MNDLLLFRGIERIFIASTIPLLLWIGYRLFVLGATGQMTLTAKTDKVQGKITNLSPGCFCFLIAVCLAAYSLSEGAHYDVTTTTPVDNSTTAAATGNGNTLQSPPPVSPENPKKSIGEKSNSPANIPKGISETKKVSWYYAGGIAKNMPTSIVIRVALSDFTICRTWTNDPDECKKTLDNALKRIPTSTELASIEQLEQNPATAADQEMLKRDRQDFVWESKK